MGLVNLENIESGMALSDDLIAPNGRLLLPKGTVFREKHLKTCKAWGITQAFIEGKSQEDFDARDSYAIDPEYIRQSKEYLEDFFKATNIEHPAMRELIKLSTYKKALEFSQGYFTPLKNKIHFSEEYKFEDLKIKSRLQVTPAKLVQGQVKLISLPNTYYQIVEVLESPRSSAIHIADVVSKDSSLAARLLKLANSAFYGFPQKIDSISKAVTIIGTNELSSLALGISVIKFFKDIPSDVLDMESFWRHCVYCGLYARLLGSRKIGLSEERLFIAGLLHDLGSLLMLSNMPKDYLQAIFVSKQENIPMFKAEQKVLGFDHSQVSSLLCKEWRMPLGLVQAIHGHHQPQKVENALEPSIVHLANIMAMTIGDASTGSKLVPVLSDKAWKTIDLPPSVFSLIAQQAEKQFSEIKSVFFGQAKA